MVDMVTTKYNLTKPEISGSPTTWGNKLNDNMDIIDGAMDLNAQAGVPVGAMMMWPTAVPPTNWLICDGSALSTTAYPKLFAVLAYTFGGSGTSFNLPPATQKFPLGAGPNAVGTSGGTFSYTLSIANLPAHNHPANQDAHLHAAWQDVHAHTVASTPHSHNISTGGHSHTLTLNSHAHGGQLMRFVGGGGTLGVGVSPNNVTGGNNTDAAAVTGSADFVGNLGGATDAQYANVGNTDNRQPGVYTDNRQPVVYTYNTGGGAALSIIPPFFAIYYIVKYQ